MKDHDAVRVGTRVVVARCYGRDWTINRQRTLLELPGGHCTILEVRSSSITVGFDFPEDVLITRLF